MKLCFLKTQILGAGAICLLDQATKWYVVANWEIGTHIAVVPGFFSLVHWRNTGAAWGILHQQTGLLSMLSLLVLVLAVVFSRQIIEGHWERAVALALIEGGIVGNLIDRLARSSVVDFLAFGIGSYQWPAFNVADSAISCGVMVYVFSSFRYPPQPMVEPGAARPPQDPGDRSPPRL